MMDDCGFFKFFQFYGPIIKGIRHSSLLKNELRLKNLDCPSEFLVNNFYLRFSGKLKTLGLDDEKMTYQAQAIILNLHSLYIDQN